MDAGTIGRKITRYRKLLYGNVLPFWLREGVDSEHGGIFTGLNRRGAVIEQDKSVWFQGRAAWTFAAASIVAGTRPYAATKYRRLEETLLRAAESAESFSDRHCYDPADGRMYFRTTRDGRPLIKRRYVFSECFAAIAKAMLARASGDADRLRRAHQLLLNVLAFLKNPAEPKMNAGVRPTSGLAHLMILINVAQELREAHNSIYKANNSHSENLESPETLEMPEKNFYTELIRVCIETIRTLHVKPELRCVLEQTGPAGEFLEDHFEGRLVNPGHSIEAAWFILREADYLGGHGNLIPHTARSAPDPADTHDCRVASASDRRRRQEYIRLGTDILKWMLESGWDSTSGGLLYFLDAKQEPPFEYWHDMKFWWPHNEAIIATLYAGLLTGEEKYWQWFHKIDLWSHRHFPDRDYGEWYGYLRRDGSLSTSLKGNMFKGPFHIPRMYLWGLTLMTRLRNDMMSKNQ